MGADADPLAEYRRLTPARIGLGRAGASLPTAAHLAFQLAHARARDAVHHATDLDGVAARLERGGGPVLRVRSQAPDRATYLLRPDLGRQLHAADRPRLLESRPAGGADLAVVIADGLSGLAVERHAEPVLHGVGEVLRGEGWRLAPLVVAAQGRVALGDEAAACLGARLVLVLIGERPGLSAPDSLGAYLTHGPAPGRTDAERNCVSNIRPEGLPYGAAVESLCWLLRAARERGLSGVRLKDESGLSRGAAGSGRPPLPGPS